jgi:hypothetical protein
MSHYPITAQNGTDTIATGATSKVITHGLGVTPIAGQINITPMSVTTSAVGMIYVDTITSNKFTVNVSTEPSTSGLAFGWQVWCPDK